MNRKMLFRWLGAIVGLVSLATVLAERGTNDGQPDLLQHAIAPSRGRERTCDFDCGRWHAGCNRAPVAVQPHLLRHSPVEWTVRLDPHLSRLDLTQPCKKVESRSSVVVMLMST